MAETNDEKPATYVSHFLESIDSIPEDMAELLEKYSGIPRASQIEHVLSLRNKAYAKCPYPCIGTLRFLNFDLVSHSAWNEHVLAPLKSPAKDGEVEPLFLDLGTCFGQDVRKLVFDGAPPERLWASDIEQDLIDLGFEMFKDRERLPRDHFLCPGDLLGNSPGDRLKVLDDRVTILHMFAVFHLFTFDDQKIVADRVLRLLRKDTGAPVLVLGGQVGSVKAGPFLRENVMSEFSHKYRHNVQSWENLWNGVAASDEWKAKIKKLEVKSYLEVPQSSRFARQDKTESSVIKEGGNEMRRHMFEVWVTFS